MNLPHIQSMRYEGGYKLFLAFDDGVSGVVDLEEELWGEIFEPLKAPQYFAQVTLDPELKTVVWPNGADFAPEFLYQKLKSPSDMEPTFLATMP